MKKKLNCQALNISLLVYICKNRMITSFELTFLSVKEQECFVESESVVVLLRLLMFVVWHVSNDHGYGSSEKGGNKKGSKSP